MDGEFRNGMFWHWSVSVCGCGGETFGNLRGNNGIKRIQRDTYEWDRPIGAHGWILRLWGVSARDSCELGFALRGDDVENLVQKGFGCC